MSGLEQFDGISVRILKQNLLTTGTNLHLITKMEARLIERFDSRWEISYLQYHAVPSARCLVLTTRHRPGA